MRIAIGNDKKTFYEKEAAALNTPQPLVCLSPLHFLNKPHDDRDRVSLVTCFHCFQVFGPVVVEVDSFLDDQVRGLFILEDLTESLRGKRLRIEKLVSPASLCRQRDEQVRLSERKDLADRVRACARDQKVCGREQVLEVFFDILELAENIFNLILLFASSFLLLL